MKFYQLAVTFIDLVVLRRFTSDVLMHLTKLGVLANFGGLLIASFLAGWLAGTISKLGPSYGQLKGLAALGVIASIAIGFMQGIKYLPLAVIFMLMLYTPLSYYCLILGAYVAEKSVDIPPRDREEDVR